MIYLGDFFAVGTVFAPLLKDIEIEKKITIVGGGPTWLDEAVDVDPCYLFECGISAEEEQELSAKLEAELEKAEEYKRAELPAYTLEQVLSSAEKILKGE